MEVTYLWPPRLLGITYAAMREVPLHEYQKNAIYRHNREAEQKRAVAVDFANRIHEIAGKCDGCTARSNTHTCHDWNVKVTGIPPLDAPGKAPEKAQEKALERARVKTEPPTAVSRGAMMAPAARQSPAPAPAAAAAHKIGKRGRSYGGAPGARAGTRASSRRGAAAVENRTGTLEAYVKTEKQSASPQRKRKRVDPHGLGAAVEGGDDAEILQNLEDPIENLSQTADLPPAPQGFSQYSQHGAGTGNNEFDLRLDANSQTSQASIMDYDSQPGDSPSTLGQKQAEADELLSLSQGMSQEAEASSSQNSLL